MPLQWLPLQQRQPQTRQPRTPVSEALTPRKAGVRTIQDYSFLEREAAIQEAKEARKFQEKMMKMQHEQEMEKAKFAAGLKEDAAKGVAPTTAGQVLGQAPPAEAAPTLTKENMPEAAMQVWEFISTLEPESQKFFIQQLKQKEEPTGYIEAPGKRVEVPGSVGMYRYLVDQGLLDPATDTVIKEKPEEMKDRFDIKEGYIFDTTTGERKKLSVDEPEKAIAEINAEANAYGLNMAKTGAVGFEDAKYDYFIDNDVDPDLAADLSKVKTIPKTDKGLIERFVNWIKGKKELPKGWAPKGAGAVTKPAFDEANVTSLVPIISDDVTDAERAHLKGQGASDSDIDEAIRRKVGE